MIGSPSRKIDGFTISPSRWSRLVVRLPKIGEGPMPTWTVPACRSASIGLRSVSSVSVWCGFVPQASSATSVA